MLSTVTLKNHTIKFKKKKNLNVLGKSTVLCWYLLTAIRAIWTVGWMCLLDKGMG